MEDVDQTEFVRRNRIHAINSEPKDRAELEARYGRVWDTRELWEEFEILGFMAPFVIVTRKRDGRKGSLEFQHHPRFYFSFDEDH